MQKLELSQLRFLSPKYTSFLPAFFLVGMFDALIVIITDYTSQHGVRECLGSLMSRLSCRLEGLCSKPHLTTSFFGTSEWVCVVDRSGGSSQLGDLVPFKSDGIAVAFH